MISGYRDPTPTASNPRNFVFQMNQKTYAGTISNSSFPNKKQAIILEQVRLKIKKYVSAIGNHIESNLIRFVSRTFMNLD